MDASAGHWAEVWERKSPEEVSWFEPEARASLTAIDTLGLRPDAPVVDVGAGASRLVDGLLDRGLRDVTLLDVAQGGLGATRARLGDRAERVAFVVADVTRWAPERAFALWHDRAVFHFLVEPEAQAAYVRTLSRAVGAGGHVILAAFAPDGPERCSGLPVQRHTEASLAEAFRGVLELEGAERVVHTTPAGRPQAFVVARFVRAGVR